MTGERTPRKASVVVIDDEELICRMCRWILEPAGFAVESFSSPHDAVQRAIRGGFDALITDLKMPGMSGEEIIRAVAAAQPSIPVLVMTGFVPGQDMARLTEQGAYDYLMKPFSAEELLHKVIRMLEYRRLRKGMRRFQRADTLRDEVRAMEEEVPAVAFEHLLVSLCAEFNVSSGAILLPATCTVPVPRVTLHGNLTCDDTVLHSLIRQIVAANGKADGDVLRSLLPVTGDPSPAGTAIAAALHYRGAPAGGILLLRSAGNNDFDDDDQNVLEGVARDIAGLIEHFEVQQHSSETGLAS